MPASVPPAACPQLGAAGNSSAWPTASSGAGGLVVAGTSESGLSWWTSPARGHGEVPVPSQLAFMAVAGSSSWSLQATGESRAAAGPAASVPAVTGVPASRGLLPNLCLDGFRVGR